MNFRTAAGYAELSAYCGRLPPDPARTAGTDGPGGLGQLAGFFRSPGILGPRRSSFSTGDGGGTGGRSRIPRPGGVEQRKPGSHWGAGSSDAGEGSAGGGE
ncbi:hypothetical protein GCM10010421_49790 [Streptomyces glaucus]|uniref:Secreted protein n=1 Tax=Streptomyces glaucus TaxID=284029 RepID=A0ABN3KA72_9ACTN